MAYVFAQYHFIDFGPNFSRLRISAYMQKMSVVRAAVSIQYRRLTGTLANG